MTARYFAHSANSVGKRHFLSEHLMSVSQRAREFGGTQPWADEAGLAGLLHDLGKYGDRFQARLQGKDQGLDHWSQGAWVALAEHRAIAAALAIQGHHVGLQRASTDALRRMSPQSLTQNHPFGLALSDIDHIRLKHRAEADGLLFNTPTRAALSHQSGMAQAVSSMLDVRLLFSCLVDADFLDTEAHFEGDVQGKRPRPDGPKLDTSMALAALDAHMAKLQSSTGA